MEEKKVVEEKKQKINGFNIAALVLGIVALVTWCVWIISIPCAVLALIFGIIGIKKPGKGMALSGIITGSIALVIWAIVVNVIIIGSIFGKNHYNKYDYYCDCYDDYDYYDYYDDYKGVYNIFTDKYDMPSYRY